MKLNCIIYTTYKATEIEAQLREARLFLLRAQGRESVTFTIKEVKDIKPIIITDNDGDKRPSWAWFKQHFDFVGYNACGFVFKPAERKKWGIKLTLNGSYYRDTIGS